ALDREILSRAGPAGAAGLQGCIYKQTGFVRNDTDRTVLVGRPGGSSYSKISAHDTVETRF
ncbi:MAG TPA: hypothetical protein VLA11_03645, partial [Woeseiaceae bacterium]|nr:hypothetical protein [Woeseiaceae bacterium]